MELFCRLWPRVDRLEDRVQVPVEEFRTLDQGRNLLLLDHLPVDELLDVRVVEVEDDHLGGASSGPARLDGPRRPVADLEEAHQPGRLPAAGARLALPAEGGEVGSRSTAILKNAGLADPQVHDPAFVHEIVFDRLDEASVWGWPLVGAGAPLHPPFERVDEVVPLRRALDAVRPMQARVEPLRAVRG